MELKKNLIHIIVISGMIFLGIGIIIFTLIIKHESNPEFKESAKQKPQGDLQISGAFILRESSGKLRQTEAQNHLDTEQTTSEIDSDFEALGDELPASKVEDEYMDISSKIEEEADLEEDATKSTTGLTAAQQQRLQEIKTEMRLLVDEWLSLDDMIWELSAEGDHTQAEVVRMLKRQREIKFSLHKLAREHLIIQPDSIYEGTEVGRILQRVGMGYGKGR